MAVASGSLPIAKNHSQSEVTPTSAAHQVLFREGRAEAAAALAHEGEQDHGADQAAVEQEFGGGVELGGQLDAGAHGGKREAGEQHPK